MRLLSSKITRVCHSVSRVLRSHRPGFIYGRPLQDNQIPVFAYHDIDPSAFSSDLEFLRSNNYQTLPLADFLARGNANHAPRSVLLTFDDARINFWNEAFPLLKQYGAHATLFVPTRWVGRQETVSNALPRHEKAVSFMTWNQLTTCKESGLVDIQSHGHKHALVFRSNQLVDFVTHANITKYDIFDWPMRRQGNKDIQGFPLLGTPIYSAIPLLSASGRILEDESVTTSCQRFVRENGGRDFFNDHKSYKKLLQFHQAQTTRSKKISSITEMEFRQLIKSEFLEAKKDFLNEMGAAPEFFAYPWMLGTPFSVEMAVQAGIRAIFGVGLDHRNARSRKWSIPVFSRIQGDWLRFLPGRGRKSLHRTLVQRLKIFVQSQHLAH